MRRIDPARRLVLRGLAAGGCAACLAPGRLFAQDAATGPAIPLTEPTGLAATKARWWKKLPDEWIECGLCAKKCKLPHEERGACGVRVNLHGEYYTLVHSRVASIHLDPIEKKPFYHVLPGTSALSLAAPGCNYECRFCQNWEIAQARPEQVTTHPVTPAELAALARRYEAPTIACTYTEPVVWSEFVYDIAAAAKPAGVRTLVISNGSWLEEPLKDLAPLLGAVKVDLKAFTESFYKELCSGELKPVQETLKRLAKHGLWTEIVVLVIPGPERRRERDPPAGALRARRGRARHAGPLHALPPQLPADERPADAGADPGKGPRRGARGGAALRLRRKCAGTRRQSHLLPGLRRGRDPPHRDGRAGESPGEGGVPGLPARDPRRLGLTTGPSEERTR